MTFFRDLAALLRFSGFRRLFAVRLLSQLSDGVFQVALAATVLFSPERAPSAGAIAAGFATILLPFSVFGPFVGVFLDRWSRRRILVLANVARAGLLGVVALLVGRHDVGWAFYVVVLAAFSVNRFVLAGLSASLPHVVSRDRLVTANAVSPTCGTLAYLLGLAVGGGIHAATHSDAAVILAGSVFYLLSALVATQLPPLGPDLADAGAAVRAALGNVVTGLTDAAKHVPPLGRLALTIVSASRLPYGVMIVGLILLSRNHLAAGSPEGGLAGAGVVVGASGLGFGLAALLTPTLTARWGMQRYLCTLGVFGAVMQVFPLSLFSMWAIAVSGLGLGIVTQGIKICVDTTVQRVVGDAFRGRVFVIYDVLFNAVFVLATVIAALVMPADGRSYGVLAAAAVWYLGIAAVVARQWPGQVPQLAAHAAH